MKVRKFYPAQVLRRLPTSYQAADAGQHTAAQFHLRCGVKKGRALISDLQSIRDSVTATLQRTLGKVEAQ